jgi:predicted Zn-dependent protease
MTLTRNRHKRIRILLAALPIAIWVFGSNACTVKRASVEPGTIPELAVPGSGDEQYGKALFEALCADYDLESNDQKSDRLVKVFDRLVKAAEVDHLPWHIYLLSGSEIVDVRAVHGNYIFVWSGVLDIVENDDELAGLLSCELAHTLAHHTDPVEFTLASDVLFSATELATSIGIMVASQGMVAIGGRGWMKWAYTELADLDPLDRKYSAEHEREAAAIAVLIISRADYSPQALVDFWKRIAEDEALCDRYERFSRDMSPQERVAMLQALLFKPSEVEKKLADAQPQ